MIQQQQALRTWYLGWQGWQRARADPNAATS